MSTSRKISAAILSMVVAIGLSLDASAIELAVNGDFETGDFTGWTQFPSGAGQQTVTTVNPSAGTYAGEIFNNTQTTNSFMRQVTLAAGQLTTGQSLDVSFDARGSYGIGGVAFAELFFDIAGGGVSKTVILGGAPLTLNGDASIWSTFNFTTTLDADVSGGVTLQLGVTNGAVPNETSTVVFDNVSVMVDSLASGNTDADFDGSTFVDGNDLLVWQKGFGSAGQTSNSNGDADADGTVDGTDLAAWQEKYGTSAPVTPVSAVPEPTTMLLLSLAALTATATRRRAV